MVRRTRRLCETERGHRGHADVRLRDRTKRQLHLFCLQRLVHLSADAAERPRKKACNLQPGSLGSPLRGVTSAIQPVIFEFFFVFYRLQRFNPFYRRVQYVRNPFTRLLFYKK